MGKRGVRAQVKEKPPEEPSRGPGRPRNKGPRAIVRKARHVAGKAIAFLKGVIEDEGAEMRYRIRAAEIVTKIAVLDPDPDPSEGEQREDNVLRVKFPKDWTAPME